MYRSGNKGLSFKPPSFLRDKAGSIAHDSQESSSQSSPAGPSRVADKPKGAFTRSVASPIDINSTPSATQQPPVRRKQIVIPTEEEFRAQSQTATVTSTPKTRLPSSQSTPSKRPAPVQQQLSTSYPTTPGSSSTKEYYMCTWRKPQGRKHKTWDGDAVLVVNRTKGTCELRCQTTRKELAFSSSLLPQEIESGEQMMVGGKEIEIDRSISLAESGLADKSDHPPSKRVKTAEPSKATPKSNALATGSRPPGGGSLMAAAPSASFYNKPLPKPKVRMPNGRVSPEVQRAVDQAESASASASSSKSMSRTSSASTSARYGGLHKPPQFSSAVEPRYDPNEEGAIVMKRPDAKHQRTYNRQGFPVVDVVVSPHLSGILRPHQVEGVKFLYERVTGIEDINGNNGAILADEMGVGKTLQTITLVDLLLRQSPYVNPAASKSAYTEKVLIVCPLSLVNNWKREFRKWLGPSQLGVTAIVANKGKELAQRFVTSKREQILVIGYEKLRSCIDILGKAQPPIGLVVCDEGHRLKSQGSKTTKVFDQLSTPRRVILTGTPIQNDLSELHAMVDFVCPGLLGDYKAFKDMFEDPILRSRVQHCTEKVRELGTSRGRVLADVTRMVILRRTKDIMKDYLMPKSECVVFCTPTKLQLDLYRHILRSSEVRALTTGGAGGSALPLITMLRQLCDSPELLLKDLNSSKENLASSLLGEAAGLFPPKSERVAGDETLSGKLVALSHMLNKIRRETDDKVVLVSTFTSTLDVLQAFCKRMRFACVRLDGQTKQDDRQEIVNTFNRVPASSSSFVFLLSSKAGGVGLNVIGASRLFLMEPEWNPALDQQAMARIHRDGQKKHCYIYRMMLPGTMDEKIFQRQISKLGLSDTLMNAPEHDKGKGKGRATGSESTSSRRSGGGSTGDTFSQAELKDIFTLHDETPCLCHDQLMCSCGGRGASITQLETARPSSSGSTSSDDELDDARLFPAFVPASTQRTRDDAELAREARIMAREAKARLAGLAAWRHFDTRDPFDFASLKDSILDTVISDQKVTSTTRATSSPLFMPSSSPCSPSLTDEIDLDATGYNKGKQRAKDGYDADNPAHLTVANHAAGNIVFVFVKEEGAGDEAAAGKEGIEASELSRSASPLVVKKGKKAVTTSDSEAESSQEDDVGGRSKTLQKGTASNRAIKLVELSDSDEDDEAQGADRLFSDEDEDAQDDIMSDDDDEF